MQCIMQHLMDMFTEGWQKVGHGKKWANVKKYNILSDFAITFPELWE